jgi:hypothetical protein
MSWGENSSGRMDRTIARANMLLGRFLGGPRPATASHARPDQAQSPWPVFIISSHRSGSTLLRYLLGAHENLACPPESKFISALQAFVEYPDLMPAFESLGLSKEAVYRRLRFLAEDWLGAYALRANKRRWVDKTPEYYHALPFIDELFEGQVLYLFLVRHPLDTIDSLDEAFPPWELRSPVFKINKQAHGNGKYSWAKYWMDVYERIHVFSRMRPERSHTLTYENLVSNTQEVLRNALDFMHEPYSAGLEKRAFRILQRNGDQDWKITSTWRVHRRSIAKWRRWPKPEIDALWELVQPVASKFGYCAPQWADDSNEPITSVAARA